MLLVDLLRDWTFWYYFVLSLLVVNFLFRWRANYWVLRSLEVRMGLAYLFGCWTGCFAGRNVVSCLSWLWTEVSLRLKLLWCYFACLTWTHLLCLRQVIANRSSCSVCWLWPFLVLGEVFETFALSQLGLKRSSCLHLRLLCRHECTLLISFWVTHIVQVHLNIYLAT